MGPKRGSIPKVPLSEAGSPEDLTVLLVPTPAPSTQAQSWGGGRTGAAPGALLGRPGRWRPNRTPTESPGAGQATCPQAGARLRAGQVGRGCPEPPPPCREGPLTLRPPWREGHGPGGTENP